MQRLQLLVLQVRNGEDSLIELELLFLDFSEFLPFENFLPSSLGLLALLAQLDTQQFKFLALYSLFHLLQLSLFLADLLPLLELSLICGVFSHCCSLQFLAHLSAPD